MNTIYIYIHTHTHTSELTIRADGVELNLYKPSSRAGRAEPSLYKSVSFNIQADYCIHERLIYFSN
jgi:hypothetical protein